MEFVKQLVSGRLGGAWRHGAHAVLMAATLAWFGGRAEGSVSLALDLSGLVDQSDVVVVVRVLDQRSYWDDRQRIVTDVRFRVDEVWAGAFEPGDEVMLRTLGGALEDGLALHVEGEPHFDIDQRVVLFAKESAGRVWLRPTGASQGAMPLILEPAGAMVHPGGDGLHLARVMGGKLQAASPALDGPTPLAELREKVQTLVQAKRRSPR